MSHRLWKHRIADILDSIKKIQKYVKDMEFNDFQKDGKTIDAVIRNFIVSGFRIDLSYMGWNLNFLNSLS